MTTLGTERLVLRPFEDADLDDYAAITADPTVQRWVGGPLGRDDTWRQIALFRGHEVLRGWTLHAVVERSSGRVVGRCGLWRPEGWPGVEIGWLLARDVWGHGYATEAATAWRDHAFGGLGIPELISIIDPENAASIRVAERIGHAYLRDDVVRDVPCLIYGQSSPEAARTS